MLTLKTILAFVGGLLESLALPVLAYFKGRGDVKRKNAEDTIENVKKAHTASSDASYDGELFKKYRK